MEGASGRGSRSPSAAKAPAAPMRQRHLGQLNKALRHLPESEKLDLFEALRRAPGLVEAESNPVKFLRRLEFNADAAAKRLATYWRFRKMFFGDRAFHPMTVDGKGALDVSDLAAFLRGYVMLLPPDKEGRSVIYVEASHLIRINNVNLLRCFFYLLQTVSKNHKSITEGFVAILLFNEMKHSEGYSDLSQLLNNAFPLVLFQRHVFCALDEQAPHKFYATYAAEMATTIGLEDFRKTRLHTTSSRKECRVKLMSLGFSEDAFPSRLGGAFDTQRADTCISDAATSSLLRSGSAQVADSNRRDHVREQIAARPTTDVGPSNLTSRSNFPTREEVATMNTRQQRQPQGHLHHLPTASSVLGPRRFVFDQSFRPSSHVPDRQFARGSEYVHMSSTGPQRLRRHQLPESLMQHETELFPATSTSDQYVDEYGRRGFERPPDIDETEELRQAARLAVNEALLLLPCVYKAAFVEALHQVPRLVESESDPLRFLRVEHYDSNAAARRLAKYWTLRKELFGDKAFLPMTQSGYGALTKEDIVVLSSGEVALLPNDDQGRGVLASDRNRMLGRFDDQHHARLRTIFYLLSTLSEEEINQKEGVVWLDVLISPRLTDVFQAEAEKTIQVMSVMPSRIKAAHVIMCPPKTGKQKAIELSLVINAMQAGLGKRVVVHTGSSSSDIFEKLRPFGLSEDKVPPVMGGSWRYEDFAKWQRQRMTAENSAVRLVGVHSRETWEGTSPSATSKKERKRMLNVIHSRQKRERRRAEAGTLQQQCNELEEENSLLKQESSRLEQLLERAKTVVWEECLPAANDPVSAFINRQHFWER